MGIALIPCSSGRIAFLYLKKLLQEDSRYKKQVNIGRYIHEQVERAVKGEENMGEREAQEKYGLGEEEVRRYNVWEKIRNQVVSFEEASPLHRVISEIPLNGSFLGLSPNLRADMVLQPWNMVVEVKSGREREEHLWQVTAYALVMEKNYGINVDFGGVLYFSPRMRLKVHRIGAGVRRKVLSLLAQKYPVLREEEVEDPGLARECEGCRYRSVCLGPYS